MEMLMLPVAGTLILLIGELADDIGVSLAQRALRRVRPPAIDGLGMAATSITLKKAA